MSFRGLEKAPFAQVKANTNGTWTLKLRRTDVKPEHATGLFALTVMYGDKVSPILEVTDTTININYKDLWVSGEVDSELKSGTDSSSD